MAISPRQEGTTVLYGMENDEFVISEIIETDDEPGAMKTISLTLEEARRLAEFINRWFA